MKEDVPTFLSFKDITNDLYKRDEFFPDEDDGDSEYNSDDYEPKNDLSDSDTAEITGVEDNEDYNTDSNNKSNEDTDSEDKNEDMVDQRWSALLKLKQDSDGTSEKKDI